ncbi:hypothetical protein Mapa_016149 [Marchantia paleacea]|nr:hypothetical protein Mapa_016149 [Marchantia paleacea]
MIICCHRSDFTNAAGNTHSDRTRYRTQFNALGNNTLPLSRISKQKCKRGEASHFLFSPNCHATFHGMQA